MTADVLHVVFLQGSADHFRRVVLTGQLETKQTATSRIRARTSGSHRNGAYYLYVGFIFNSDFILTDTR